MKSIMHSKEDRTCYLCMLLHNNYRGQRVLQEHHVIFGTGNRKLSDKYGLMVYLCPGHHLASGGPEAVHRNQKIRLMLAKKGQQAFEREYPTLSFREIFGINYLDPEEKEEKKEEPWGFFLLEDEE